MSNYGRRGAVMAVTPTQYVAGNLIVSFFKLLWFVIWAPVFILFVLCYSWYKKAHNQPIDIGAGLRYAFRNYWYS